MSASIEDVQLVESHRAGNRAAFTELVRAYEPELRRHALRRLHDSAAADDAVQETFARAFRALHRVDGDYRIGPWLHRICANVCIDEANRRRREDDKARRWGAEPRLGDATPGVEEQLGLVLDDSELSAALDSLPPTYREALQLRFVDDLTYDEVAQVSGVSEENARARVSRARTALRHVLRGVAVLPLLVAAGLRKGQRAAVAADGAGTGSPAGTVGATAAGSVPAASAGSAQFTQAAASLHSALDAASTVVAAGPQTVPLLTKAAVGIGMVAVAIVPSSGPTQYEELDTPSSKVAAPAAASLDPSAQAPSLELAEPATRPLAATGGDVAIVADTAPAVQAVPDTVATGAPVDSAVVDAAPVAVAPEPTVTETVPATPPATEAPPPPTVPPVIPTGGTVFAGPISAAQAGPRIDVSGPVQLSLSDAGLSGSFSGRVAVEAEPDAAGAYRLEAVLDIVLDDGRIVGLRLAGQGTGADPGDGSIPPALSVSGVFRASSGDVALIESGSFSGSLELTEGGSWTLTLGA